MLFNSFKRFMMGCSGFRAFLAPHPDFWILLNCPKIPSKSLFTSCVSLLWSDLGSGSGFCGRGFSVSFRCPCNVSALVVSVSYRYCRTDGRVTGSTYVSRTYVVELVVPPDSRTSKKRQFKLKIQCSLK
jgi:hypothetical protein